jgi:hypothetical protein
MIKGHFFFLICLLLPAIVWSQTPEVYKKVKIDFGAKSIQDLARLGIEADHGLLIPGKSLTTEISTRELDLIQKAGFHTTVLIPDLVQWHTAQKNNAASRQLPCLDTELKYKTPVNYTYGSMNGYQTLDEILAVLDDMHAKYPNLISARAKVSDTITTYEGRPMWYVRISDNPEQEEQEPAVLYTALHHAREPNSMSQMLFYMWHLLENYGTNDQIKQIVDHEALYFVPCVNPDGYAYNEFTDPTGFGYWRKNRRPNSDGTFGVDLNRNYGYFWGNDDIGSSGDPISQVYRGTAPFSEAETRMVRDFAIKHDFSFALHYHTAGNLLIYPWAYSDTPADSSFVKWSIWLKRENNYKSGTASQTVGYQVNGDSNDWIYSNSGTYGYTPEVGTTGFWPQFDEIDGLNKDNLWQNLSVAYATLRYAEAIDKSANNISEKQFTLPLEIKRYGQIDGPFKVNVKAVSTNASVSTAAQTIDLQLFASKTLNFNVQLAAGIQVADQFALVVEIDNGFYTQRDTLRKTYGGKPTIKLNDNAGNISKWSGTWGLTDLSYHSAPTSFTDSPIGNHIESGSSSWTLNNFIPIPANAQHPQLRFWARWELGGNDGVRVLGRFGNNSEITLCGQYTKPGEDSHPTPGEPLFVDFQNAWVEECMDLSDFIGASIKPVFELIAKELDTYDGFYLDDVRIEYVDPLLLGTQSIPLTTFDLNQNQPNPSSGNTLVSWSKSELVGEGKLIIYNQLGEQVAQFPVNFDQKSQIQINTSAWPAGVYTYMAQTTQGQSKPKKMLVGK